LNNVELEPLFASPLIKTTLDVSCLVDLRKNIISNHSNHTTINDDIEVDSNVCLGLHKKKKFFNLKKSIEHKVCSVLHDLYNVEGIEFYLCDMWSTCCLPGEGGDHHFHANSFYSGVFYPFEDTPSGLVFYSPVEDKFSLDITGNITHNHQFNTPNYVVNPKECELIFFPSYLHHKVLKNKSKTTRYSIAFNIYVKGNLKSPTSSLLINTSIKT